MHSCGAFLMWILSRERLSVSNRMAVSALQRLCYHWINPLLTLPVRKMTTPSRRPIANGLARRGLDDRRHVGLTCFTRASNQPAPAVVSARTFITQHGAVEP